MSTKKLVSFLSVSLFLFYSFIAIFYTGFFVNLLKIYQVEMAAYIVINVIVLLFTYIVCKYLVNLYINKYSKFTHLQNYKFYLGVVALITFIGFVSDTITHEVTVHASYTLTFSWILHYISFVAVFIFIIGTDFLFKGLKNIDTDISEHKKMQEQLQETNKKADKIIRLLTKKK